LTYHRIVTNFYAFGHTLYIQLAKKHNGFCGLFLCMRSKVPSQIGFKFTVGRYNAEEGSEHVKTHDPRVLSDYPSCNGNWNSGVLKAVPVTDLNTDKLLTPEGTLQIKAVVYKTRQNA
jgi:hypothetical protein